MPAADQNQTLPQTPTVVFCLPGSSFSGRFLECWTNLVAWCFGHGIRPVLSRRESCNIYYVRNMCLGADVSRGENQRPFDGKLDYDYLMWIDSDILFTPEQFARLLAHQADIVAGVYLMEGGTHFATVKDWDEEYFAQHGCFQFLTAEGVGHRDTEAQRALGSDAQTSTEGVGHGGSETQRSSGSDGGRTGSLLEVAYTGMGFMLVKRGVFESMEYPWFRPIEKRIGSMVDFTMEDVSFCLRAKEKGWKVLVDRDVKVGHEKRGVL